MSDTYSDDADRGTDDNRGVTRRRMMQSVGAGIGGLTLSGFAGEVATAKKGCARGPFERTYEPGTVNVGQIRAEQACEDAPGPSIDPASPRSGAADGDGEKPPRLAAQESNVDDEGPLTIRTEYDGVNSLETRGGVPSDSQVAAGNGQLIHALNRDIAIYNKQSGRREQFFRLEELWDPVIEEPEGGFAFDVPFVFDPRARYDRNADRFILAATQFQFGLTTDGDRIDREDLEEAAREDGELDTSDISRPPKGWFLVAVSATSNPNGKWYVYRVPPEDKTGLDNEGLVDYPTLGFDEDAVYMTQNFFGTTKFEVTMVAMDKAAMYAGETVTAYHFDQMNDPDSDGITFTVHPAQQPFSGGSGGPFYLANSDFPFPDASPETLTLWELSDPVDDSTLECFTLDVDPYFYPDPARQPESDSRIDTLGTRLMNVDFDDGSVWTAHSTAVDWNGDGTSVAAIRWYEIDASGKEVVQSGTYGEPDTSYFMPTIGSEGDSTVIAHNVSGPDTFPRMDVAGRTADYTLGELEDGIVVESGKSKYNALGSPVERWDDYNGVSVDPVSGRFWTVSQYSPDINIPVEEDERDPYFTRIAEVYFDEDDTGGSQGGR